MDATGAVYNSFPTTAWTEIGDVNGKGDSAKKAMTYLCELYRPPVYSFFVRRIRDQHKAQDVTQEFFTLVVEKRDVFSTADKSCGKFRTYLAKRLSWFLSDYQRQQRKHTERFVLTEDFSQRATEVEIVCEMDVEWTKHTLALTIKRLDEQYHKRGNERRRQVLALHNGGLKSTEIARKLSLDIETVKNDIRAIKRDSRETLRTTIRAAVANDDLADQEMSAMKEIIAR